MQNNNQNFLDKNTFLAIILVGLVWFMWQAYLEKKYPPSEAPQVAQQGGLTEGSDKANNQSNSPGISEAVDITAEPSNNSKIENGNLVANKVDRVPEENIEVKNDVFSGVITSKGFGFKSITLSNYQDREGAPISFTATNTAMFATQVGNQILPDFKLQKISELEVLGEAQVGKYKIVKRWVLTEGSFKLQVTTGVENLDGVFPGVSTLIEAKIKPYSGSFLLPSFEHQEFYTVFSSGSNARENLSALGENKAESFELAKLMSLGDQFFATAVVDKSEILPKVKFDFNHSLATAKAHMSYQPAAMGTTLQLQQDIYAGPKDVRLLEQIEEQLAGVVNFGFFASIAKPLLAAMKWFYSVSGNWGIAIILLTLLVRLIVLPLHIMSFKSMKVMQQIQPEVTRIREKYKDDPMAQNREVMDLFKRNKVNPMGGCLPMLLQIPVFFALYQVFGQSIELYRAPFMLWVQDLSSKDPYFVLPILMAITMFIQQKITPTTMDPTQAKIMLFLPIVFSLMMFGLPSALTLYLFVSTLFGVIQQYLLLRDKKTQITSPA